MHIPDDEQFIRRAVQRKATGKTARQIDGETRDAYALLLAHEAGNGSEERAHHGESRKAEWKHAEWRRIFSVMAEESMEIYDPGRDPMVARWRREREEDAVNARARNQEAERLRQESADELYLFVCLRGEVSRRLQDLAAAHGTSVEQVMIQLAANTRIGDDGRVCVPPFTAGPS